MILPTVPTEVQDSKTPSKPPGPISYNLTPKNGLQAATPSTMSRTRRRQRTPQAPQPEHQSSRKLRSIPNLPPIPAPKPQPPILNNGHSLQNNFQTSPKGVCIIRVPAHTTNLQIIETHLIAASVSENTLCRPSQTVNCMPDIRNYWDPPSWGNSPPGWSDRRIIWFFANTGNPLSAVYGWYAIFVSWDKGYMPNRNVNFAGLGRSVHKDVFIVKAAFRGKDKQGRTGYVDIPLQFLAQDVLNTVAGGTMVRRVVAGDAIEGDKIGVEKRIMREALSG